jgi:environmental stress-induced protein Ves
MDSPMTTTTTTATELSRKRSRLSPGLDDDHEDDTLKKTRTQCELDELNIVSPRDAWRVDVDALLGQRPWPRYRKGRSTIVVCVQGNMQLHHDLLRYVVEIHPRLCACIGERERKGKQGNIC